MAEKNEAVRGFGSERRQGALRAKDIIPGAGRKDEGIGQADIPQFDLAEDIMAEQRRLTASHRKGPGQKPEPQAAMEKPSAPTLALEPCPPPWDPLIVEIVARDIERLCGPACPVRARGFAGSSR